ncbi:complement C5 [Pelobates cultripes]|uniref:Complement C5 n=1 Tax=Pelobates cultripes TaxID=61616 RepID=A0AAD1T766_PELCU|nr:complement C5 [Pelobates cultripes]CAH2316665.1 complement C5 [Pelobates cultripes]CAH2316666.1 complement C5 [Pelobates cultripes]CAH2316667.1 complement C5 [Pelobates cultripes]CAH2316668.1 complement C5 [Pelobates cultripes]
MILLQIALLLALYGNIHCQERTYIVLGPRVWRVGASETVVVQAFGMKEDLKIKISLLSYPDKKTEYASQSLVLNSGNNYQGLTYLMIQPKQLPRKSNTEQFVYLHALSNVFTKEEKVPVTYNNGFLFIQTDKPVYTPDQSVKMRVYSMDEELKPARRRVTLTFEDPEKVKVDIMGENDVTGIISFPDFKIPTNPKFGMWSIHAAYENDFTTSTAANFEVKEYVLPRFFISIQPEKNFICHDNFENFEIKVKANYYYNKKVNQGMAYIRYGIIQNGERTLMPKSIDVSQVIDGEAVFNFNSKKAVEELGYHSLDELDGSYLYITVSIEEPSDGRTEESENIDVKYILSPYILKLIGTPLFVKPTLPYYIEVQLKDTLDKPVGNIPIMLTGEMIKDGGESEWLNGNEPETKRTLRNDGTVVFIVNIPSDVISLEFKLKTADDTLPEENQASASYVAKSYKSLTKSYLYISWARQNEPLKVGQYLSIQVVPSSPYVHKITHYSYLIMSKGKILKSETVPRFYDSVSQNVNIPITETMIPSIRILVYYIVTGDTTAELIADSIWVDLEAKCVNNQKVQVSARKGEFKPKEDMSLTLQAQANSLVALSAVDVAVYDIARKSKRPLERVLRKIEESDLGCGAGAGENNVDVFRLAGLTFLTNANIRASQNYDMKCTDVLRPKRSISFNAEIKKKIDSYKNIRLKTCCGDGVQCYIAEKDCAEGISRVKKLRRKECVDAFSQCCTFAKTIKEKADEPIKEMALGRMYIRTILDIDEPEVRSYFPESWLWEEHTMTSVGLKTFPVKLPDSLTTWEILGIGMSDKGMCVAEPLKVLVWKDLFVDVQLPYSVVRGEQVQLKVVVYNYKNSNVKGCITVSVGKEICLFGDSTTIPGSRSGLGCNYESISTLSLKTFTYSILPLELGLHTINFTLKVSFESEILVKTLRVVSEGVQQENYAGFTLDPQAIRGITKRRQEVTYKIPPNIVPKSPVNRILTLNGKILGEVMNTVLNGKGLNYVINLPKGSAETELMRVLPIFYVYHYLATTNEWNVLESNTFLAQIEMERKMKEGFTSLISFRNVDFSYSIWRDSESSTWLTAFALRIFGDIQKYVTIDTSAICNSMLWLIENSQAKDGSFVEQATYKPTKMHVKIPTEARERSMYLTAFALIGLSKSYHMCKIEKVSEAIHKAEEYLSKNMASAQSTYSLAISAYALTLSDITMPGVKTAITKLKGEALYKGVIDNPVYRYWKDTLKKFDPVEPSIDTALMVETTAYALMAFLKVGEKVYSQPIVKWLQDQQHYGGSFFSTQDTAIALKALTEVAILDKKLTLNMAVEVSYRKSGSFKDFRLTEQRPFSKPVEVPIAEDLIIATKSANGIATGHVRTVYHLIKPVEENCHFDITIRRKPNPWQDESVFEDDSSQLLHLEACAKYLPKDGEVETASHTVMELSLVTGLEADEQELDKLVNRVDQFVVDYSLEDGRIILHFDSISSDVYVCTTVRVRQMFKVRMLSPATFKVYEFHAPEQQCTIFYNPYADDKLVKICSGDQCRCMAAECPKHQTKMDLTIGADARKKKACNSDLTYAYKVQIEESERDVNFVKYTATILDIFNKGTALVKLNKKIKFIKKKTCSDFDLLNGDQFLMMGKDGASIRTGFEFQYEYPLDSSTWVEWWPENCDSQTCETFSTILNDFSESILFDGC